jgi:hypothetical protein
MTSIVKLEGIVLLRAVSKKEIRSDDHGAFHLYSIGISPPVAIALY